MRYYLFINFTYFKLVSDFTLDKKPIHNPEENYSILSLFTEPAFVIDLCGKYKAANAAANTLFGQFTNSGQCFFRQIDKTSNTSIRSDFSKAANDQRLIFQGVQWEYGQGQNCVAEFRILKKSDHAFVTVHLSPISSRKIPADLNTNSDNDKLLEAIPAPVFRKNTDHIYTGCNNEFLRFLGLSREEVVGKNVYEVAPSENAKVYQKADEELFASGGKQVYETTVKYADGSMHDVVFHKSVFMDDTGKAAGLTGIILDITSRKAAERRAQESDLLFQAIVENCPAYIFIKDRDGKYIVSGDKFTSKIGWPKGSLLGKSDDEIFPQSVARILKSNDQKVIKAGKAISEKEAFVLDGQNFTNMAIKFPLFDAQGDITGIAGIATDISELVEAEEKLKDASRKLEQDVLERTQELSDEITVRQRTEAELHQILSSSPIGVGIADMESGEIIFCNDRLTELLAPDQKDVLGELSQSFWVSPAQHKKYLNDLDADHYIELQEAKIYRKNRNPFWANVFGNRIVRNNKGHIVFWIFDLTQIKTAQEDIRKSEIELRNMLSASPVAVTISEKKTGLLSFVNKSTTQLLGASEEELIGSSTLQFWNDTDLRDEMLVEFEAKGYATTREVNLCRANEEHRWVSLSWTKLTIDGEDKIVSWLYDISQIKDAEELLKDSHEQLEKRVAKRTRELEREIADRKRIEDALRESEAQFEASANSASDWFWGLDHNFRFNSFSERMEEATGIDPISLLGSPGWKALKTNLSREHWDEFKTELIHHRPFRDFKFDIVKKDGDILPVTISGIPIFDESGVFKGYRGAGRDISQEKMAETEAKKLEQQLHQSQKMEAIGQLTGGVAHDFNNILAIILGNVDLINDELADDSLLYPYMKAIEGSATRGAQLTHRLLAYSRKQALNPQKADLDILASGIIDLIDRLLGNQITIHCQHASNLRSVFADPSQIEHALMNLCINASDAMPSGGDLYIKTGNMTIDEVDAQENSELSVGDYSWLSVRDTGVGMDKTTLEHAFEPFYTTKEVGKGTGLGLSTIYGFAKQSNGTVILESKPEHGTTVTLLLPSLIES